MPPWSLLQECDSVWKCSIIKDAEKKEEALKKIINKYAKSVKSSMDQDMLGRTEIVEITVEKMDWKAKPPDPITINSERSLRAE